MTCNLMLDWLDDYLEGQLDPQNRAEFEKHIAQCESCRLLVEDLKAMREVMEEMPLMPLPSDFNESLHEKLIIASEEIKAGFNIQEINKEKKKSKKLFTFNRHQMNQYIGAAAVFALLVVSAYQIKDQMWWNQESKNANNYEIADAGGPLEMPPAPQARGAGSEDASNNQGADSTYGLTAAPESANATVGMAKTAGSGDGGAVASGAPDVTVSNKVDVTANRDLIRSGDLNLRIADYDKFYTEIEALVAETGGYIESSYTGMTPSYENNKFVGDQMTGSVVLRLPSKTFDMAYEKVKKMGVLQSGQQNVQDVTSQISDLKATLSNLKARESSLRRLMSEAKSVTEIMEVERELSSVRTQIDQLESSLKSQQQQVSLSTLYINVQVSPEVGSQFKYIDGNLLERAKQALIKNINSGVGLFETLFVGFVAWLPLILVLGLGLFGFTHTKHYKNWRNKK